MALLRSFKLPRLWLGLWLAAIIALILFCLGPRYHPPGLQWLGMEFEHVLAYMHALSGTMPIPAWSVALLVAVLALGVMAITGKLIQRVLASTRGADRLEGLAKPNERGAAADGALAHCRISSGVAAGGSESELEIGSVPVLHSFKWPRLWLGLWIVAIVAVIVVCLGPPPKIPQLPSDSDKVEHFLAYFLLSWGAVQLFARRRTLLMAAVGLVLMGIAIEFAQGAWTTDRSADPLDAVANSTGVVAGMLLLLTPLRGLLQWLDRRLFGGR